MNESCNESLTYNIGEGGPYSDCRHTNGYHYCVQAAGHDGPHKTPVKFDELVAVVEWSAEDASK